MSDSLYIIRNYRPSDFEDYVKFRLEAERLEPTGCRLSRQVIAECLGRPNYSPEQNLFIIEIPGRIIGFMDITPEINIGRVILDCQVHQEYRQRGLATRLLRHASRRARELKAKAAHVNIRQENTVARSVLSRLGFKVVRQFLELSRPLSNIMSAARRINLPYRHLQPGEEGKLTRLQNRCFAGTWGYHPNTVADIAYSISLSHSSPENIILTAAGDKLTGYCWMGINDEAKTADGERKGRILMLGVDPDYRGKGMGRKLLLAGLSHLHRKGMRTAELTVDSGNEAACALYRAAGFQMVASSLWYEKTIDPGD